MAMNRPNGWCSPCKRSEIATRVAQGNKKPTMTYRLTDLHNHLLPTRRSVPSFEDDPLPDFPNYSLRHALARGQGSNQICHRGSKWETHHTSGRRGTLRGTSKLGPTEHPGVGPKKWESRTEPCTGGARVAQGCLLRRAGGQGR